MLVAFSFPSLGRDAVAAQGSGGQDAAAEPQPGRQRSTAGKEASAEPPAVLPVDVAWTTELDAGPLHLPAYDGTRAFISLRNGELVAVDLRTGELVWSVAQPADQAPVAGGGVVIVAGAGELIALRAGDGLPHWRLPLADRVAAPLLLNTGWLIVAMASGELLALRAPDGREMWRRPLHGTPTVQPAIAGERLLVSLSDGRIATLALGTGAVLWERELSGRPQGILPLDAVFVGATDNHMYRLSLENGDYEWYWRAGGDIVGTPAADADRVYFTARDNVLRALDRGNGARRWRVYLAGRPVVGPVPIGSVLAVSGVSPTVTFFDAETGQPAGEYEAPGDLAAPPHSLPNAVPPDPRLTLLTRDGEIIGLAAAVGPLRLDLGFPPHPFLPLPERLSPAFMAEWHELRGPGPPIR